MNRIIGLLPIGYLAANIIIVFSMLLYFSSEGMNSLWLSNLLRVMQDPFYLNITINTILIANAVAISCTLTAYAVVFFILHTSRRIEFIILLISCSSMFINLVIRSSAWTFLFASDSAIVNFIHLISPVKDISVSRVSVVVAMTHILVPYSVAIQWSWIRNRVKKLSLISIFFSDKKIFYFLQIYLPVSVLPFILSYLLIFVAALGFYVTPELVGRGMGETMMLGMLIEDQINIFGNWSTAAWLSLLIIIPTCLLSLTALLLPGVRRNTSWGNSI